MSMLRILGCDVSVGRTSESVFLTMEYAPGSVPELDEVEVVDIKVETLTSLPDVVDRIAELEEDPKDGKYDHIGVDGTGFGRGAVDYLLQKPFAAKVTSFISNTKASREWEDEETKMLVEKQYANFKTRVAMEARRQAYRGRVRIRPVDNHERLLSELPKYQLQKIGGRWKIEDPKPSPDVGDAFIIAYSLTSEFHQTYYCAV